MILKVLIVEDEENIRLGLVNTVDWIGMGLSVIGSAADGAEGLRQIRALRPDVVIADIKMPGMNGIDMLEEALKEHAFKSILLTSYSEFEYARRAVMIRTYDYLLKPLDEDKLRAVVEKIRRDVQQERRLQRLDSLSDGTILDRLQKPDVWLNADTLKDRYVEAAVRKIIAASDQKLSIEGIADELYVSASYLSRRFKEVMGQTFLDTLNMYRIQQAIRLLGEGGRSISEVAEQTGLGDYKHFCNVFKRYTSMTPREFMRGGAHAHPAK